MKKVIDYMAKKPFWCIAAIGLKRLFLGPDSRATLDEATALAGVSKGVVSNRTMLIPIFDSLSNEGWWGSSYTDIGNAVEMATADSNVERVILYIDSPGGEVTGLPELAAQIAALSKIKNVTAVVSGMAASAAYWLATQARDIVLTPSGVVGSVGVRMMHIDFSKNLEDAGIKVTELFAGDFKTEFSPYAPLTPEAKQAAQDQLDSLYSQFLEAVANGRGERLSKEAVKNNYGNGRILDAQEALAAGMIDRVMSPRDFFKSLAPVEQTGPYAERARVNFLKEFGGSSAE